MGGPIVRTGTTPAFWKNWEKAFGGKSKAKSSGKSTASAKLAKPAKSAKAKPAKKKKK